MIFSSSVPFYLDPPNWQQQPSHVQGIGGEIMPLSPPPPPPPPPPATPQVGGSIRPGSLTDRARQAKIPLPEAALKCPRCESTNTKFCYFNNYSLTQPRHFCKTCRRYWTRGGALRNVPVGGGCRRNKKSKQSRRSKSPATTCITEQQQQKISTTNYPSSSTSLEAVGHGTFAQATQPQLGLMMPHLHDLMMQQRGLSFVGTFDPQTLHYHLPSIATSGLFQSDGLDHAAASYVGGGETEDRFLRSNMMNLESISNDDQMMGHPMMKNEESQVPKPSGRQFVSVADNNQYWSSGSIWSTTTTITTDLSSLASSSNTNLL